MENWQALVLGIVQGFTEFLPISSSGHLILVPWIGDWTYLKEHPDFNVTFDVALNIGTLLATISYFWRDLVALAGGFVRVVRHRRIEQPIERQAMLVVLASIPAGLIGVLFASVLEDTFGEPWQMAIFLSSFGILLWIADAQPERETVETITRRHALLIGCAQALALMPGVSRSGVTITAGRFLGLTRDAAARFSFLIYTPIVGAAVLYKGAEAQREGLPPGWEQPFLIGILGSTVAGFIAIWALLAFLRNHSYRPFVYYRIAASIVILLLIATGVREATF